MFQRLIFIIMAQLKQYPFVPAKFYSSRRGKDPIILVLHYTAGRGNSKQLASFFAGGSRKASAHFGVGRVGDVIQMVDTDASAWHAGKSKFRNSIVPVGQQSIGVEICNTGHALLKEGQPTYTGRHRNTASKSTQWEIYPDAQVLAVEKLINELVAIHPTLKYVTGHEDIRNKYVVPGLAGSKIDPGPAFPWDKINFSGLELWHYSFRDNSWYNTPNGEKPTH